MRSPLRIIYPYVGEKHYLTVQGAPPEAEWHDVGADDRAYHRLMCSLWEHAQDHDYGLVIVEHDVMARPEIFETFATDPDPWVVFPYNSMCHAACQEAWANMLGCTRFSSELIHAVPDAVSSITKPEHLVWLNLCDGIGGNLREAGFSHSWRYPHCVHHHQGRNGPVEDFINLVGPMPETEN